MSVVRAIQANLRIYFDESKNFARHGQVLGLFSPKRALYLALSIAYVLIQAVIILLFKPAPPKDEKLHRPFGRIAVVGAGLTGISSAAHCIAHNFDVVIFEADDRPGGIWAHVNKSSGLQLNSLLYRFHPGVLWSRAFPYRDEILGEITRIWKEYRLVSRTRFNTPVTSVCRADGTRSPGAKWIVNDGADGAFDAIIVTIGTCGEPQMIGFPGMPKRDEDWHGKHNEKRKNSAHGDADPREDGAPSFAQVAKNEPAMQDDGPASRAEDKRQSENGAAQKQEDEEVFEGDVIHSSQLDEADFLGKTVVVVGSGASGVEAVETALQHGAKKTIIFARDDKWIIPRNIVFDTIVAAQPFGQEMPLSFVWEAVIRKWQYHGVEDLIPADKGLYVSTPVVNDEFLNHVRASKCDYVRGDTLRFTQTGVQVRVRPRGTKPGQTKRHDRDAQFAVREVHADKVVLATGYKKPSVDFLPRDLFPEGYDRPDLYLQNFSTEDWSVLLTNSAYVNAIGTVGHFHIGIYTRILLIFLLDESARPTPKDMKLWVDAVRFIKRGARGGALQFFTYMELTIWFVLFHVFRPDRIRWVFFVMQGWGVPVNKYNHVVG